MKYFLPLFILFLGLNAKQASQRKNMLVFTDKVRRPLRKTQLLDKETKNMLWELFRDALYPLLGVGGGMLIDKTIEKFSPQT